MGSQGLEVHLSAWECGAGFWDRESLGDRVRFGFEGGLGKRLSFRTGHHTWVLLRFRSMPFECVCGRMLELHRTRAPNRDDKMIELRAQEVDGRSGTSCRFKLPSSASACSERRRLRPKLRAGWRGSGQLLRRLCTGGVQALCGGSGSQKGGT